MNILFSILIAFAGNFLSSIYSIPVTSIDNSTTINLSAFQGKKILLVNIASGSEHVSQLGQLQDLYSQYGSSLVIIAFPSNSFGNEERTNSGIQQVCANTYNVSFPIASKGDVKGNAMQPIYKWLTTISENGVMSNEVKGDFQKYLVNEQGALVGVFAGSMPPNHPAIIEAITTN